jgi:hypothetical protein
VQKSLLEHKAQGFRQALTNLRLRRKRGKALPLEQPEEYHGGAVFWSPRKVKEASDCQQQQEQEEEQQRPQKAGRGRVREDQKQTKLQAVQQRHTARAAARVVREKEKLGKLLSKSLGQLLVGQRLQQALETAQMGKKRSLKAASKAGSKKRAAAHLQGSRDASGRCSSSFSTISITTRPSNLHSKENPIAQYIVQHLYISLLKSIVIIAIM